jgi:hypothetical protein
MTATLFTSPEPSVVVNDGTLYVNGFTETDDAVVGAVAAAEDGVAEVRRLLRLGAQVDRLSGTTLDVEVLNSTVDKLRGTFESTVDTAVEGIQSSAKAMLDPATGELPQTLAAFKGQFESMLGTSFDPDSRKSILGKFDEVMRAAAEEQTAKVSRLFDTSAPDSPLNRLRDEVAKTVKAETATVAKQVGELSERLAVQAATAATQKEMANKTTAKGFTFEDVLHGLVEGNAVAHQDLAAQTGRDQGSSGTLRGDEVVTVNPEETRGLAANIVFECKDKKLGLKKILDELDGAMANRDASVGIAVFASADIAPIGVPFAPYGNKAILVLDKEDPDPSAVRLAYMWGRWVAKRELAGKDDAVDLARVESLLDDARRALQRATQMKKCHTTARKSIDEATAQVEGLVAEVTAALDDLCAEVGKAA